MEKLNFVRYGELRLPPGFRFRPTDEELVFQYLKCKAFSCSWPACIIPEVEVCKSDPLDLPGDLEQERYFFITRDAKYRNGNRLNRATGSGYWKTTGLDKKIVASKGDEVVGMKKILVFYKGKHPHASRTDWIMHEYRLVFAKDKNNSQSHEVPVNNGVVLCRIFLKKKDNGKNEEDQVQDRVAKKPRICRPVFYDFMKKTRLHITDDSKPDDQLFLG